MQTIEQARTQVCCIIWRHLVPKKQQAHVAALHLISTSANTVLCTCLCAQVLREEGKFAYAAAWHAWRTRLLVLAAWAAGATGLVQEGMQKEVHSGAEEGGM